MNAFVKRQKYVSATNRGRQETLAGAFWLNVVSLQLQGARPRETVIVVAGLTCLTMTQGQGYPFRSRHSRDHIATLATITRCDQMPKEHTKQCRANPLKVNGKVSQVQMRSQHSKHFMLPMHAHCSRTLVCILLSQIIKFCPSECNCSNSPLLILTGSFI